MLEDSRQALPVSAVAALLQKLVSDNIGKLRIRGEVSNIKFQKNGNVYFSLKDEQAKLNALVMHFSKAASNVRELKDGMEIIIYGNVSYYKKEGYISIFVDTIEFLGEGLLKKRFDELKAKLEKEGLFDKAHKKPVPHYPSVVGVVTSPSGAAIRDILNITGRRFNSVHIVVFPAAVQGDKAAGEIARAIRVANRFAANKIDVLIVGRGGGAIEDLWCFNEEAVARAIYESDIPVISAVGHEIDYTISDYVADLRAPTPSAAAELVVKDREEIISLIETLKIRLENLTIGRLETLKYRFENNGRDKITTMLQNQFSDLSYAFENQKIRFDSIFNKNISELRQKIRLQREKLNTLNPLNTLARGYSITYIKNSKGELHNLKDIKDAKIRDTIHTLVHKGSLDAVVTEIEKISDKQ